MISDHVYRPKQIVSPNGDSEATEFSQRLVRALNFPSRCLPPTPFHWVDVHGEAQTGRRLEGKPREAELYL